MREPIEAVTVCVGYSDFLEATAPHVRPHVDRWVVVTDPSDEPTRETCRRHAIECVLSEEHRRTAGDERTAFAKGRLVTRGLAHLSDRSWLLHLDADIALPADFRELLADAHLDDSCIHGCDRLNVIGYDNWKRVEARGLACRRNAWLMQLSRDALGCGSRVALRTHGYCPIGYFQLWHGGRSGVFDYPIHHGTAARTDVQHALRWDRRQRVLIPELIAWHLESEPAPKGANWNGRTTRPFGPAAGRPKPQAFTAYR